MLPVAFLAACGKSNEAPPPPPPPPPEPTQPLRLEWHGKAFEVIGDPDRAVTGSVEAAPASLRVVADARPGVKVKVGDSVLPTEFIDIKRWLGSFPLKGKAAVEAVQLSITYPDARSLSATVPRIRLGIVHPPPVFAAVAGGQPLVFVDEADAAGDPDAIARPVGVLRFVGSMIGAPATLRDVDWVAVTSFGEKVRTKPCKFETTDGTQSISVPLELHTTNVAIVDRRTGTVVDKKSFEPTDDCPQGLRRKSTDTAAIVAGALPYAIDDWLTERLAKK